MHRETYWTKTLTRELQSRKEEKKMMKWKKDDSSGMNHLPRVNDQWQAQNESREKGVERIKNPLLQVKMVGRNRSQIFPKAPRQQSQGDPCASPSRFTIITKCSMNVKFRNYLKCNHKRGKKRKLCQRSR